MNINIYERASDIPETDQWLLDGECFRCRKKNYCSKACTKNKARVNQIVKTAIAEEFNGRHSEDHTR